MINLKSNQKKTILIYLFIIIILFSLRSSGLDYLNDLFINNSKVFVLNNNTGDSLDYKQYINQFDNKREYIFQFSKKNIENFKGIKGIGIYKLASSSYKVYLNNKLIGINGDIEKSKSNIWNDFKYFTFTDDLIKNNNILKIKTTNSYESGLQGFPIIISSINNLQKIESLITNLINSVIYLAIGLLIATIMIFTTLIFLDQKNQEMHFFVSLGAFFMAISILDYIYIPYMPFKLITFKKLVLISYYYSTSFYSLFISKIFNNKTLSRVSLITVIIGSSFVFINDIIVLMFIHKYIIIILAINIFIWLVIIYKNFNEKEYSFLIFTGSFVLLATSIYDIYTRLLNKPFVPMFIIGIVIFLVSIFSILIKNYRSLNQKIKLHKFKAKKYYKKAIRDPLTGAYNRQYLNEKLKRINKEYFLIVIDLDDFKEINDNYGHLLGDKVLKRVYENVEKTISNKDYCFRIGGDEFLVILNDYPEKVAIEVKNKIKCNINKKLVFKNYKLDINTSLGFYKKEKNESFDKAFKKADNLLYESKKKIK
ncbi:MAG: GGDEF domain-containing protein [Bacillota bacterium]